MECRVFAGIDWWKTAMCNIENRWGVLRYNKTHWESCIRVVDRWLVINTQGQWIVTPTMWTFNNYNNCILLLSIGWKQDLQQAICVNCITNSFGFSVNKM